MGKNVKKSKAEIDAEKFADEFYKGFAKYDEQVFLGEIPETRMEDVDAR